MGWDSESFIAKNDVLLGEKKAYKKTSKEKKPVRCQNCNGFIGTVSITLYEIDEKHYCSGCYSR